MLQLGPAFAQGKAQSDTYKLHAINAVMLYGSKQPNVPALITYFPMNSGMRERASELVSTGERVSKASKAEQANE